MSGKERSINRAQGRPAGGGKTAGEAREAILDAAEQCLLEHGPRLSTMEMIAGQAGYTRTIVYRHFATRNDLLNALVARNTTRYVGDIFARFDTGADGATKIVEAFVILATELTKEPIFALLSEQIGDETAVDYLAHSTSLATVVESLLTAGGDQFPLRQGLRPLDAAHYLMISAIGMLRGVVPDTEDADQIRRYTRVFVLPGLMADPPPVEAVFKPL